MNQANLSVVLRVIATIFLILAAGHAVAYERYQGGCNNCHGDFTDATSTKGSTFPSDNKHEMHRASSAMNADCDLCHTNGDNRNPFIGSSNGTNNNTGYGCMGCHGRVEDAGNDGLSAGLGAGLRQHHDNSGVTICAVCHSDASPNNYTPVGEDVRPPYYGTVDTNANDACNPTQAANTNENWTIGDFQGTDNDGDLMYDFAADSDCAPVVPTPGDLGLDGKADILWRNASTGQNWVYMMSGATIGQTIGINRISDTNWQIVGNGDYDGDGDADILWRNASTGQNWMYLMYGANLQASLGINRVSDTNWKVVGSGDFDGDGDDDIFWRDSVTGNTWMYLMNGAAIQSNIHVNTVDDTQWDVAGVGDFDADGRDDILWRNSSTGKNWVWFMNGATITTSTGISSSVNSNWSVVGTRDHNGDGRTDILWRNSVTGQNWVWLMNGVTIASSAGINTVPTAWQVAGTGDYDGDGNADILWRHGTTGQNWMYLMNGANISATTGVNTISNLAWQVVNTE